MHRIYEVVTKSLVGPDVIDYHIMKSFDAPRGSTLVGQADTAENAAILLSVYLRYRREGNAPLHAMYLADKERFETKHLEKK